MSRRFGVGGGGRRFGVGSRRRGRRRGGSEGEHNRRALRAVVEEGVHIGSGERGARSGLAVIGDDDFFKKDIE